VPDTLAHTFLLEAGRWTMRGRWQERNGPLLDVIGKTVVVWSPDRWFTWMTKLVFLDGDIPGKTANERVSEVSSQYRGRLNDDQIRYTFVVQHSIFGRIEGEGWLGPEAIVQRYWVLDDAKRRSGFQTLYRLDESTYSMTGGIQSGPHLASTLEARLERRA